VQAMTRREALGGLCDEATSHTEAALESPRFEASIASLRVEASVASPRLEACIASGRERSHRVQATTPPTLPILTLLPVLTFHCPFRTEAEEANGPIFT
jgi:hypothetical protein